MYTKLTNKISNFINIPPVDWGPYASRLGFNGEFNESCVKQNTFFHSSVDGRVDGDYGRLSHWSWKGLFEDYYIGVDGNYLRLL